MVRRTMSFTTIPFILFFFTIFVINYYVSTTKKPIFLLIISYFFYGFFDVRFLPYLFIITIITYLSTNLIFHFQKFKKISFSLSVTVILGLLFYFKYFNFFAGLLGTQDSELTRLLLPIGISFITFQSLGYIIDVYRDRNQYESNLITVALFVSFFPQITSGPISRANTLIPQIKNITRATSIEMESGLYQFLWGFFKKVVIADNFAKVANLGFDNYTTLFGLPLLISVLAYTIQIYGDFSGYSDMAIGLSKMLGFKLKDNFNAPYLATSIKDFWSRWHISLSTWFRDYVYIPLGGSRVHPIRKYINLMITFIVSGLWHGANLTFILWGALHGFFQIIEDLLRKYVSFIKLPRIIKWFITMSIVSLAWIFFRAQTIEQAFVMIQNIVNFTLPTSAEVLSNMFKSVGIFKFDVVILIVSLTLLIIVEQKHMHGTHYFYQESRISYKSFIWGAGLILVIMLFGAFTNSSFIYFNF